MLDYEQAMYLALRRRDGTVDLGPPCQQLATWFQSVLLPCLRMLL